MCWCLEGSENTAFAGWKYLRVVKVMEKRAALTFSIPVTNESRCMASLCPQYRNNFRRENHSELHRGQELSLLKGEMKFPAK